MKKSKIGISVLLIAIITSISLCNIMVQVSSLNITVEGDVRDDYNTTIKIVDAKVKVYTKIGGEYVTTVYTNSEGRFSVQLPLNLESYKFVISKTGVYFYETLYLDDFDGFRFLRTRNYPNNPIRLVRIAPYHVPSVSITTHSIPTSGIKSDTLNIYFHVNNHDTYYTINPQYIICKIENTKFLDSTIIEYSDFNGWVKIPDSSSDKIQPGSSELIYGTLTNVASGHPFVFLYDSSACQTKKGLFAFNIGEYEFQEHMVIGNFERNGHSLASFTSQILSQVDSFQIVPSLSYTAFTYVLYDYQWYTDYSFHTPNEYFFDDINSPTQTSVNDRFWNEFTLRFQIYEEVCYPSHPKTYDDWITYGEDYVTTSQSDLNLANSWQSSVFNLQVGFQNHGFDILLFMVGEIGDHYGQCFGSYSICFTDSRVTWFHPEIESDEFDNLIQHEISHCFDAVDHEERDDPPSVMTYWGNDNSKFFENENWLSSDIQLMIACLAQWWII